MTIAEDLARAGSEPLQQGLDRIDAYYAGKYRGPELRFYSALNDVVRDPDRFGGHYTENTGYLCPELTRTFVAAALAR